MIVMRVNPNQLRTLFLSLNRIKEAFVQESKNLTSNCAKEYKRLLIQNIVKEKFASSYDPLNDRYVRWKESKANYTGFWKLWGDLMLSISIRETPKGHTVEIPKDELASRSSQMSGGGRLVPIWKYAYYGEFGRGPVGWSTKGQPARPIFHPSTDEYRRLFMKRRRKEALDKIRRSW